MTIPSLDGPSAVDGSAAAAYHRGRFTPNGFPGERDMKPKRKSTTASRRRSVPAAAKRARKTDGPSGVLERLRALCLSLPETSEVEAWGHPTFRVRDKIFVGAGAEDGKWSIGVKATPERQSELVATDQRFTIARYVGKHGWVTMSVGDRVDWDEVAELVRDSYRLVAPKTLAGRVAE
jgi:predicted DNA-binding protein (MmcQ/YjbR family)